MASRHILPRNDIAKHSKTIYCSCKPEYIGIENGFKIIIHNAFDAREIPSRIIQKFMIFYVN